MLGLFPLVHVLVEWLWSLCIYYWWPVCKVIHYTRVLETLFSQVLSLCCLSVSFFLIINNCLLRQEIAVSIKKHYTGYRKVLTDVSGRSKNFMSPIEYYLFIEVRRDFFPKIFNGETFHISTIYDCFSSSNRSLLESIDYKTQLEIMFLYWSYKCLCVLQESL